MPRFAESTTVSPEKSRAEIEATVKRYGASSFYYGVEAHRAAIGFTIHGHTVQLNVPLPDPRDKRFTHVLRRGELVPRTDRQRLTVFDQEIRQRWRALLLLVKANLEAVELGLLT